MLSGDHTIPTPWSWQDREVGGLEPVGVDRHERRRERPAVVGQVERGEVDARGRPEPFGEVEDQLVRLLEAGQEVLGLGRLDVGDLRQRVVEVDLARVLDVADVAAIELLDPVVAVERDALRGRHARHEALALDIADDRLGQAEGLAEDRHRAADRLAVGLDAGPLAAVLVDLERRPERQRVVAQVVVELDQPGVDRALGGDARRAIEAGGRGRSVVLDADDPVVGDVQGTRGVDRPGGVDGDDPAGEDVAGRHQGGGFPPGAGFGASHSMVNSSGRLTLPWPPVARTHASFPMKAGTPNGRSRAGIGA